MNAHASPHPPVAALDAAGWERFLARSDMRWDVLPRDVDEAPFVGNGRLGAILWQDGDGALRIEVPRCDRDGRKISDSSHFVLAWRGSPPHGSLRLDQWNAELRGGLAVGGGDLALRCFVHAELDVIVLRLYGDGAAPDPSWHPDPAGSTRTYRMPSDPDLVARPPSRWQHVDEIEVSVQEMPAGGLQATAWLCQRDVDGLTCLISIQRGAQAAELVARAVQQASGAGLASLATGHRAWWHDFHGKSLLAVSAPQLASFDWIQMHTWGSASAGAARSAM